MPFYTYAYIGQHLVETVGVKDTQTAFELIQSWDSSLKTVAVLARISQQLDALNEKIDLLYDPPARKAMVHANLSREKDRIKREQAIEELIEERRRWEGWLLPFHSKILPQDPHLCPFMPKPYSFSQCQTYSYVRKKIRRLCVMPYTDERDLLLEMFRLPPEKWNVQAIRGIGPAYAARWKDLFQPPKDSGQQPESPSSDERKNAQNANE